MKGSPIGRTSAAQAGWWVLLLLFAWLAFVFVPLPHESAKEALPPPRPPPSRLRALGLPDNPDFAGLPEFFALWADHAEWQDNRTRFAYWNPGTSDYSYFIEAVKVHGGFRFRVIREPQEEGLYLEEVLAKECPIRFYRWTVATTAALRTNPTVISGPAGQDQPKVKVDLDSPGIPAPASEPRH